MKPKDSALADNMRPEYNFDYAKAMRGKYYKQILKEGANVVVRRQGTRKAGARRLAGR